MFFFVIAPPGRFGMWCDAIVAGLSARALGPTGIIHANSLEELSSSALQLEALRAVVAARHAGGRLRRALIDANRKFIVAYSLKKQYLNFDNIVNLYGTKAKLYVSLAIFIFRTY